MKKINTVCLVDDDEVYQFIIRKELELTRMVNSVITFNDGLQMLEFCKANASKPDLIPEVILLDINMPLMTGWEFLQELEKIQSINKKKIHILIVSSSIDKRDIKKADLHELVSGYLIKPVDRQQLSDLFEKM
jgi:CheY-like chemotaxis protein